MNISRYIDTCIWFIIFCECNILLPVVRWRILFINKTKQSWTHFIKYLNQYFFPVILNIFVWVIFTCVFIFIFINMPLFLHVLIKFNMTVKSGRRYLFTFIGNLQTKAENRSYEIIKWSLFLVSYARLYITSIYTLLRYHFILHYCVLQSFKFYVKRTSNSIHTFDLHLEFDSQKTICLSNNMDL